MSNISITAISVPMSKSLIQLHLMFSYNIILYNHLTQPVDYHLWFIKTDVFRDVLVLIIFIHS